jgi:MFS family permease
LPRSILLAAFSAFLVMLGFGVLFPVLPQFTQELGLSKLQYGLLMSSYPLAGVLVSPLWGRFADRRGRRPAIALGLAGIGLSYALFALGTGFGQLLAARILGGLLGAAALPAVFAYAADVSSPENRSAALGAIGAAIALGLTLGPAAGGLLSLVALRAPYFASAGIGLGGALLVQLTLPESLDAQERARRAAQGRATRGRAGGALMRRLGPLLGASLLLTLARLSVDVTVAFLVADRLGRGPASVGLLLSGLGLLAFGVQGGAIRPLAQRLGDRALFRAGGLSMGAGLLGVAWAFSWPALIGAGALSMLGFALHSPTLSALISRGAGELQGEAQGLNSSAQSLARVAGPVLFARLYEIEAWMPYALGAALCVVALVVAARGPREPAETARAAA